MLTTLKFYYHPVIAYPSIQRIAFAFGISESEIPYRKGAWYPELELSTSIFIFCETPSYDSVGSTKQRQQRAPQSRGSNLVSDTTRTR